MTRCLRAVAVGSACGIVAGILGIYIVLMYGPDTLLTLEEQRVS